MSRRHAFARAARRRPRRPGALRGSGLWVGWALRDARRRWVQVVSIALLLALGVGMYSAMSSLERWRTRSANASFSALSMHTLRVSLPEGSYSPDGSLQRALAQIPDRRLVQASAERLVVATQVDASSNGHTAIVPGRLVGAPVRAGVDRIYTNRGTPLRPADEGRTVAQLDVHFADHYHLAPSGSVRLTGGRRVGYVGLAEGPEYFIITAPGADFGAEASFAVLYAPLRTVQALTGRSAEVNQLVLRLRAGASAGLVERELTAALRGTLPAGGFTFTRNSEESDWRLMYRDAEGDQRTMNVFAFLLLGAAVLAAFNLVSRSVEAQRREIGIGMALGLRPRTLALRPLLLGAQVASLGVLLGVPAGLLFDGWLRSIVASFFPLPVWRTPLEARFFLQGAAFGLVLPMLATALALRRALRATPVEAIRVGARAAKSSGLAWLARGLHLPGGSLGNLPLRNVLRTPRRTAMTLLGIGAVVSIVIALSGAIDSFDATLSASTKEALAGASGRLAVDLVSPARPGSRTLAAIERSAAVGRSERSLRMQVTLSSRRSRVEAFLEVVGSGRLWHPTLASGALPSAGSAGVAISRAAARDLHVAVGDRLLVRHAVPSASGGGFRLVSTSLPVTAIDSSPFRFIAYANRPAGDALGVSGLANRISVVPARGIGADAVKRALLHIPGIAAVQGAAASSEAVKERMNQFTEVLLVTVAIAMAMALLIGFNSTVINTDERLREHATMFAYGVTPRRVLLVNMTEELLVGLLATALGFAGGYAVLRWMIEVNIAKTLPDIGMLLSVRPATILAAILAGTVIVALAPLLTLRRLRRTDVPAALRVVE